MAKNTIGKKKGNKIAKLIAAFFTIFVLLFVVILFRFAEQEKPQFAITNDILRLGASKEINFVAADSKSGIQSVTVQLKQKGKTATVYTKSYPRLGYFAKSGPETIEETITVIVKDIAFDDGSAELIATVNDFSWWNWMGGNIKTEKFPLTIDTKPPKITIIDSPHYISPGGSGVITYRINEKVEKHGLNINGYFHPGYSLSESKPDKFVAYIGLPHKSEKLDKSQVMAIDSAGNKGKANFSMIIKNAKKHSDKINIGDSFLDRKLPEFSENYPEITGTPVEQYVYVNNKIRKQNNKIISEITRKSSPTRLWEGRFKRMGRSSSKAVFADHRTYYYNNKKIDQQYHLGTDLASTRHAEVKAANHGIVVFAEYLGIYGNTVILDHGQGVFSLYSHMSQIKVAENDGIKKDEVIGNTGTSGMAGGDHLHFSILINGIFVNPLEWWDPNWLKLNITGII